MGLLFGLLGYLLRLVFLLLLSPLLLLRTAVARRMPGQWVRFRLAGELPWVANRQLLAPREASPKTLQARREVLTGLAQAPGVRGVASEVVHFVHQCV